MSGAEKGSDGQIVFITSRQPPHFDRFSAFVRGPVGVSSSPRRNLKRETPMRARYACVLVVVVTGAVLSCASSGAFGAEPKLYWTEDEGSIRRSNLDGSNVETVIETRDANGRNGENFAYLTADLAAKKLYYAIGSPTPQLWSADYDGGNRQLLATLDTANYVRGLAFDHPSKQL